MIESIVVGLGSIGAAVAHELGKSLAAVVEISEEHPPVDVPVVEDIAAVRRVAPTARVAILTTTSRLSEVAPRIEEILGEGLHVVSTCEELSYPTLRRRDLAESMDRVARENGRVVIGVGVNPGFVMDLLPLIASRACVSVDRVEVERIVDTTRRRGPLRKKVGEGLPEAEWRARAAAGRIGHVGLAESAALLAAGLGWPHGDIKETLDPVLSGGVARGLVQTAVTGDGRVSLRLEMAAEAPGPRDHIRVFGDPPIDMILHGGIQGDRGTVATVLHAVRRVGGLAPGLRTILDL